jgi:hypothetical protein
VADENLARMDRCRQIALELGFQPVSHGPQLVHNSDLAVLNVTSDTEVEWHLSFRERRSTGHTIESASLDLSNLTETQFRTIVVAALSTVVEAAKHA